MFKFYLTSLLIAFCESAATGGYGGSSGGGGGYGGASGGGGGYGGGSIINVGGNGGLSAVSNNGPIPAAIQSTHTVEIQSVPVPYNPPEPQVIEVDANVLPLTIHFKSASSNINVVQSHTPGQVGQTQQTSSEDEPHHLLHEVTKPIIQEVREVITPYRRVVQEIRPVQEEIQTIVARGEHRQQQQFQQNNLDFGAFNGGRVQSSGGYGSAVSGGYGGSSGGYGGSSGGYGGSSGSSILGGSVSILNTDTSARTTGTPGLSSFSSSSGSAGKKSRADTTSAVTQERTKDYAKSS